MEHGDILKAGGFFFLHNFDSGNLGHVEQVPTELIQSSANHRTNNLETPDFEFNVWTRPDCAGTQFENGNRTWFYFGVQGGQANALVRLNIINLNKQGKMYNQGMAPVTRTLPGQPHWERIRDRPLHSTDDNTFTLTFKYRTPDNIKATTFFAFTYPFSFAELQIALNSIDLKFLPPPLQPVLDDIYYCRENLVYSLEGRRMDLLTISSYHGVTSEREERLKYLFPDNDERPFKFLNKKVIFVSARVHPGETPSSFVFNGFLNLLLTRNDPIALQLRKLYVFKLVPFLNPDGVARGHYRTDTRGVNLNRVYLNPSIEHHPTVFAARALIRYHHFGHEKDDDFEDSKNMFQPYSRSLLSVNEEATADDVKKKKPAPAKQKDKDSRCPSPTVKPPAATSNKSCGPRRLPGADSADTASRSGDTLAEQVCDLKLQEIKSELKSDSITSGKTKNNSSSTTTFVAQPLSLLDAVVVRDCLGSEVHLSRSDELNFQGPNPLRQLRDTLKNSISLLIGANGYRITPSDSTSQKEEMKLGWCRDCKNAISETEENSDENLVSMITLNQNPSSETGVWREESMFCSSCLKRYNTSELEEEIMAKDRLSRDSVAVSGDVQARAGGAEPPVDSTGDTIESKPKVPPKARKKQVVKPPLVNRNQPKEQESGLYLYIDLHGHASKKGIFMYGNYFEEMEASVECMLLPRIMSLNNLHFHFSSCNFTERNMYLKDRRDGMSREGSGRVAVLKATGLVRSYTLECNYNTGRLVNVLPPTVREAGTANGPSTSIPSGVASAPLAPPKYSPHIFEEVGRSLGASILDLTGHHPNSRIPSSEHRTLGSLRDWLRSHSRSIRPPQLTVSRLRPKAASPQRAPLYARSLTKTKLADVERKENTYIGAKPEGDTKKPATARSGRSNELIVERFTVKKSEKPYVPRPRYFAESELKPKSLSAKRRNVLAIRKPNAGKARSVGGVKSKSSHRRGEESEATVSPKVSKASAAFGVKTYRRESAGRAPPSTSSSEEVVRSWEEVAGGTGVAPVKRRPSALPAPRLKKIRLKTAS